MYTLPTVNTCIFLFNVLQACPERMKYKMMSSNVKTPECWTVWLLLMTSDLVLMLIAIDYVSLRNLYLWLYLSPYSPYPAFLRRQGCCSGNNGLPPIRPIRRQATIWTQTSAEKLLIWPLGTNVSEILIKIQNVSFAKMHLKMSPVKRRPFCPGGDELTPTHNID